MNEKGEIKIMKAINLLVMSAAMALSVTALAETKVNMTRGLHNFTTEDDVVIIKVPEGFPEQASNGCANANLRGDELILTLTKSMEQGEYCSIRISDGKRLAVVRFHVSESDS